MQLFEIILLSTSIIYLVLNLFFDIKINKVYLIALLSIVLLVHLLLEGYRWQMLFSYFVWLIAIITIFKKSSTVKTKTINKVFKAIALSILFAFSIFFPTVLPVFELPEIKGPYSVGTTDILLELNRDEVITENKNDKRKLMIKVWYPSHEKSGQMESYIDDAGRHGFAQKYGLPKSTFNYLDKVNTHVFRNISAANGNFPVLIFSHGYNSKANNYYALLSQIVSQGYVVFAINHTYESTGTTFPDGTEVYFDNAFAQKIESGTWKDMEPVIKAFKDDLSFKERHPIVKEGLKNYFVKDMVERWAKDITDVADHIEFWNSSGLLKNKLDIKNIGVFGHSRGGGAAGDAFLKDARFKAGANVDGVQWGNIVDTSFQNPFLFISADWPEEKEDLNSHAYINKSQSVFYESKILNTGHSSFMDIPFMIPLESISEAGTIQPEKGIEITSKLLIAFFDSYLKNKKVDFNHLESEYDLLNLKIYKNKP